MSSSVAIAGRGSVKGWCPGALRPMQTGDGLIVRVRPRCGTLSVEQALGLAEIASSHGNGLIDFTRRANIQIRGVHADDLPHVWTALSACDLIDENAEAEAIRNVMINPLTGIDPTEDCNVQPIAHALEMELARDPALWSLPGKFGFVLDGGGMLPLDGERADIRLKAVRAGTGIRIAVGFETRRETTWLRLVKPADAHLMAVRLAHGFLAATRETARARMRDLGAEVVSELRRALELDGEPVSGATVSPPRSQSRVGLVEALGDVVAVGIGAPFGRIEARGLKKLAANAGDLGLEGFRLSPWRILYASVRGTRDAALLLAAAEDCGFIASPDNPLLSIDACPGAPACRSARLDTRAVALRIAEMMPLPGVSSVHVSGCTKGCARSAVADLVLVDRDGGFGIIRDGSAGAAPIATLKPADLSELPAILKVGV